MSDQSTNCQFCGNPLKPSARYCDACGQPVVRPSQEATILAAKPPLSMVQGDEDIVAPSQPTVPPAEPTVLASNQPIAPESPRHDDIPDYPVVTPAPPQKKSRTGLIIALILGGGLLCLLTMTVIGYFVIKGITKNIKPTIESRLATEVISLPNMAEATFEPIPLDPANPSQDGGVAEVTLEPIDSLGTPEKPSILTNPPESQIAQDAVIFDDFSSDVLDWGTSSDEISIHQIEDGAYTIRVLQPEYIAWSEVPVDFYPVYTEFDAWVPGGGDGGSYGILCHFQSDNDYYYVEIDLSEEAYSIGRYLDGEYSTITDTDWPYTDALNAGSAVNHVYVGCELDKITLFINDQFVDQTPLPETAQPGAMEIFGSTWDDMPAGGYKVYFDNFTAWKPEE